MFVPMHMYVDIRFWNEFKDYVDKSENDLLKRCTAEVVLQQQQQH